MLSIRLIRKGKKKRPFYRIVVMEKSKSPRSAYLELLGDYDPIKEPIEVNINKERFDHWLSIGAKPTDTVRSLVKQV